MKHISVADRAAIYPAFFLVLAATVVFVQADTTSAALTITFESPHWLVIHDPRLPEKQLRVNYLEAYCRANSADADWMDHTVIPHRVEVVVSSTDHRLLRLRDTLVDGLIVEHTITAHDDNIDFRLIAHNPGSTRSAAHWAQACPRLAEFTGFDPNGQHLDDYLPKCFIFLGGKLTRLSEVRPWAKQARYTPGQVWCPPGVPRSDVNPRPLSDLLPDNGLIGAFSKDERLIFATAWQPYQELFQGVARCVHADFRLGGLQPGETKDVRGKIYLVANDVRALLARYAQDFPEQQEKGQPALTTNAITSLADPSVRYAAAGKPYVMLKRGGIEAVVVDNRAVDDQTLPRHAAGYHGIAALRHDKQPHSLFVPFYAGLNFEHIHDGTNQSRDALFEPRRVPMELRVIDEFVAELYQPPTPHWGLESCMRYELLPTGVVEMTFECIPRRDTFKNGYCGLFWANYVDHPESLDIHFFGKPHAAASNSEWQRGVTPKHGTLATHRPLNDSRSFVHDAKFPLELPFGFSQLRYSEPWYFGVSRGMAFVQMFRPQDSVWISQSPSGGGNNCPAWDFQWFIERPQIGQLYQLKMRAAYLPLNHPDDIRSVRQQVQEWVHNQRGWNGN